MTRSSVCSGGGASDQTIMKSQGINENTLGKVKKSNGDWDKYRELHSEMIRNATKPGRPPSVQVVEHRQSIVVQANHYMMEELKKQTETLKLISNKLAFIVDELTGTK